MTVVWDAIITLCQMALFQRRVSPALYSVFYKTKPLSTACQRKGSCLFVEYTVDIIDISQHHINQISLHKTIITKVGLFGYVIYSSVHIAVCINLRIDHVAKPATSDNNGAICLTQWHGR